MADEEKKDEKKEEGKADSKEEENKEAETSDESKPEPEETAKEDAKDDEASEEAADEAKEATDSAEESKKAEEKKEEEKKEEPKAPEPKPEPKAEPKKEIKVSGKLADIIKDIETLSVLELADLVKALEDKFGVSAAPVAVAGAAPTAGGGEDAETEEQTTFNVILTEGGANKISVIKAVREVVPTLGLKEAKDLVDAAPKPVLEGAGKDDANEAKKKLEDAGGKVELQ